MIATICPTARSRVRGSERLIQRRNHCLSEARISLCNNSALGYLLPARTGPEPYRPLAVHLHVVEATEAVPFVQNIASLDGRDWCEAWPTKERINQFLSAGLLDDAARCGDHARYIAYIGPYRRGVLTECLPNQSRRNHSSIKSLFLFPD